MTAANRKKIMGTNKRKVDSRKSPNLYYFVSPVNTAYQSQEYGNMKKIGEQFGN